MMLDCKLFVLACFTLLMTLSLNKPSGCASRSPSGVLASSYDLIPNFQSGVATLVNKAEKERYNYYNITLQVRFISSYELAISFQNINSFSPSTGLDFFVNALKKPTYLEIVFAIDPQIAWINAEIYFIVTARQDFAVGIFLTDNAAFLQTTPNGSLVSVNHYLKHSLNANNNYLYAIPFISGVRTFDVNLNFTFTYTTFNPSTSVLTVQLTLKYLKYPLESLYISYLIFNMGSDLEISSFSSINYAPNNVNVFIGLSGINPLINVIKRANITNSARTTNTTKPLLGTQKNDMQVFDMIFGINGIIIQTQQSMDLLFRSLTQGNATLQVLECISKSKCNSLAGTMIYNQSDVYSINSNCIVCMENAFYNNTFANCQCVKGFTLENNSCIKISQKCLENSTYNNQTGECQCNHLFINISNKCISIYSICKVGQIYFQGKCIKIVYSNSATAKCSSDSLFINKTCIKKAVCFEPQKLNTTNNKCECPPNTQMINNQCVACSVNETFIARACECKAGYFRIKGGCLACSPNAFFNGTTCVCFRNYSGDGFKCTQNISSEGSLAKSAPKGTYSSGGGVIILN